MAGAHGKSERRNITFKMVRSRIYISIYSSNNLTKTVKQYGHKFQIKHYNSAKGPYNMASAVHLVFIINLHTVITHSTLFWFTCVVDPPAFKWIFLCYVMGSTSNK